MREWGTGRVVCGGPEWPHLHFTIIKEGKSFFQRTIGPQGPHHLHISLGLCEANYCTQFLSKFKIKACLMLLFPSLFIEYNCYSYGHRSYKTVTLANCEFQSDWPQVTVLGLGTAFKSSVYFNFILSSFLGRVMWYTSDWPQICYPPPCLPCVGITAVYFHVWIPLGRHICCVLS